jgi:hypothetical protein
MRQIKERKMKYRNTDNKRKAAFCRSGSLNSKTIGKSMNLTMKIIRRNDKNCTVFLEKSKKSDEISRRRKV